MAFPIWITEKTTHYILGDSSGKKNFYQTFLFKTFLKYFLPMSAAKNLIKKIGHRTF